MDILRLQNASLSLTVAPQGASVFSFESLKHNKPVFYPAEPALFPMLPLANRVEGNQFRLGGEQIALPQSPVDERFFLHGDGWIKRWKVEKHHPQQLTLSLESRHACGFDYLAHLTYRLVENQLRVSLELTHLGDKAMVYGLGLHPYFALEQQSRVQFLASGYWPEGELHLPLEWQGELTEKTDFSSGQVPADEWLNVGYSGWSGNALIESGAMRVRVSCPTPYLMVFRMQNQPFICLEPQTHPANAHNLPGMPGLLRLGRAERTRLEMVVEVD
ncbi:aldose 1-epimerase [Cedecea davisae]|uniref:aldose 1-epimerase n=1 Tax=Cedecea davisae TaxID=158484 RepID=UPI00242BEDB3|nr:aldose 1-epimerase [Cedecea davisae]